MHTATPPESSPPSGHDGVRAILPAGLERRAVERYFDLAKMSADGILVTDTGQRVLFANQAMLHLLGYASATELLGQALPASHWADASSAAELWADLRSTGALDHRPVQLRDRAGKRVPVSLSARCMLDEDGQIVEVQYLFSRSPAIPETASLVERQRAALLEVRRAVHDLNQPLTVVTGYSSLLLRVCSQEDAHHRTFEAISRSAQAIGEIVRRIGRVTREVTAETAGEETSS